MVEEEGKDWDEGGGEVGGREKERGGGGQNWKRKKGNRKLEVVVRKCGEERWN